jgi:formiminotetrahydrofolate cyclodeaminase
MMASSTSKQLIGEFVKALSAKVPTPGGGASSAVAAAIGGATSRMACEYTKRKKDKESGAADHAENVISTINFEQLLQAADDDAAAYADLQRSWKDTTMTQEEKTKIEARALAVPVQLMETCHQYVLCVQSFLPHCNPNITSDAKAGIYLLSGAARAAYETAMVNSPPEEEKIRLKALLKEIRKVEDTILDLE